MLNVYKYIQAFSIDIALGGVVGTLFIAKYVNVDLDYLVPLELFITIWLIYTFDHLIDAGSGRYDIVAFRHQIHARFSTTIWGVWSFSLILALSLLFKIPSATLMVGSILGVFVVVYFFSLKLLEERTLYHKEVSAAIIYTTGIFVGPLSVFQGSISFDLIFLFIEFFLIALINLLLFSMYEQLNNEKSGFQSLLKSIGFEKVRLLTIFLFVLVLALSIVTILTNLGDPYVLKAQLILLMMTIVLVLIFTNRKSLMAKDRYRIIGDAVFFIPVIYLFV